MSTDDSDEETLRSVRRDRDDETIVSNRRGSEDTARSARHRPQEDTVVGRGAAARRTTPKTADPTVRADPAGGRARIPHPGEVSAYPVRPAPDASGAAAPDRPAPAPAARRIRVRRRRAAAPGVGVGAVVGIVAATGLLVVGAVAALIVLIGG